MNLISIVDKRNNMSFMNKRLSRDQKLTQALQERFTDQPLLMNSYSYKLYGKEGDRITENPFEEASSSDWVLSENLDPLQTLQPDEIENLVLYRFDRDYPGTLKLGLDPDEYECIERNEIKGNSHETIFEEIYRRR